MASRSSYRVTRLDQLRALASPIRDEIVARLSNLGPASIGDVARSLGRKPQALYPHFELLQRVGLVRRSGERADGGRPKALYETPGRELYLLHDKKDATKRQALADHVSAGARRAARNVHAALLDPAARTRGPRRDTLWFHRTAWVTSAERARINELLSEVFSLLGRAEPEPRTSLQAVAVTLYPVAAER